MDEYLVGYLLGSLDEADATQVERYLQTHPEVRQKLARLKRSMSPLAADLDDVAPPPGLAGRTLAVIAEHNGTELPRAPREPTAPSMRMWWRRSDVAVAAALLILALGVVPPVAYRFQRNHSRLACQNNLQQFSVALHTYYDQHDGYPDLNVQAPRNVAGLVVPVLADAGVLPATFSVCCPAVGPHVSCPVTLASLRRMSDEEFQAQAPKLSQGYAFTLGYRDETGAVQAPWQAPGGRWPILADSPPTDGSLSNSANHDGVGQNVLFLDGSIRFVPQRTVGDPNDDIFLNRVNCVAAGVDARDFVLGSSAARP
jgi:hypothetical protein